MSSSFGPKNHNRGRKRQDGHQHERIRPAHVAEAVDRRTGRQSLAALESDAQVARGSARPRRSARTSSGWFAGSDWMDGPGSDERSVAVDAPSRRERRGSRSAMRLRARHPRARRHPVPAARCVRDQDDRHPGRLAGPDAVQRVLDDEARRRLDRPAAGPPRGRRRVPASRAATSSDDTTTSNVSTRPVASSAARDHVRVGGRGDRDRPTRSDPSDRIHGAVDPGAPSRRYRSTTADDDRVLDVGFGHVELQPVAHRPCPRRRVRAHDRRAIAAPSRFGRGSRRRSIAPRPTRSRNRRGPRRGRR